MKNLNFFDESREQSKVKAEIVANYLWAWAKVVIPTTKKMNGKIAYIDLFAGPGRYKDGMKSTPLMVLEKAINDVDMRNMLVTIFSDADPTNTQSLQQAIGSMSDIHTLKYVPKVHSDIVDERLAEIFESIRLVPSLIFLDPWGYKSLSCRLINSVIKDWGCDCIMFFNYNRINMGLGNNSVEEHMNALFGKARADYLRKELTSRGVAERESLILASLSDALKELGGEYVLPFRFRGGKGNRISHHLIFVTKHPKGYHIMKGIMANASSSDNQGVPSFEYSSEKSVQPYLIPIDFPLNKLKDELLRIFAGQSLTVSDIYAKHNVGTCYIMTNYKKALIDLEKQGKISVNPPADKRPKRNGINTLADTVNITFPAKEYN